MDTQNQDTDRTLRASSSRERAKEAEGFRGVSIGRIAGVEIRLDWSLLIIFVLIAFSLGTGLLPSWHPTWDPALVWTVALAASIIFLASILVHELSHALVGRTQGISVPRITLFVFGGMAHLEEGQPPSPKAEFLMAVVGPIVSIVIGVLALAAGVLLAGPELTLSQSQVSVQDLAAVGPVATLLLWLGPINIVLGLFNLIPGFPLDGGRVLRSILWAVTGDITRATKWASGAGQLVAWLLMAFGVLNVFGGAFIQGLWLLLIGWFLNNVARMSYQQLVVHKTLENVPVSRLMRTQIDKVTPDVTIDSLVRDHFMATDQAAFPVERGVELIGLVCLEDIRRVPEVRWHTTKVEEVMTPVSELSALSENESAERALVELARRDVDQIPILDGRRILGLVRRSDIVKWMSIQGV